MSRKTGRIKTLRNTPYLIFINSSSRIYQTNTFSFFIDKKMTPELEQLHLDFQSVFGKEVPSNKKNDAEWIQKKIDEANEISTQDQTDPVANSENTEQQETVEQEQEPELQNPDEEEEYSSEEDTQLSYEAKKISKIKYPL